MNLGKITSFQYTFADFLDLFAKGGEGPSGPSSGYDPGEVITIIDSV